MKQLGLDGHAAIGFFGAAAAAMTPHEAIACCVGGATFVYMLLRGAREYVKLRKELKNSSFEQQTKQTHQKELDL